MVTGEKLTLAPMNKIKVKKKKEKLTLNRTRSPPRRVKRNTTGSFIFFAKDTGVLPAGTKSANSGYGLERREVCPSLPRRRTAAPSALPSLRHAGKL
jgi:hypothetical protein